VGAAGSAALAFALIAWSVAHGALVLLVLTAASLDAAVQLSHVTSMRTIYLLAVRGARAHERPLFVSPTFASDAIASALYETLFGAFDARPHQLIGQEPASRTPRKQPSRQERAPRART
jgi:hypothetical protein